MTVIASILRNFGFTVRELADVLFVSHSMLVQIDSGRRRPNKKMREILAKPLFAEADVAFSEFPQPEMSKEEKNWYFIFLVRAKAKYYPLKTKWEGMVKKRNCAYNLLYHLRNLPESEKGKDLFQDWWLLKKAQANLYLTCRDIPEEIQLEKKVFLLEKEIEFFEEKCK